MKRKGPASIAKHPAGMGKAFATGVLQNFLHENLTMYASSASVMDPLAKLTVNIRMARRKYTKAGTVRGWRFV
jgi:hypothetical protein